MTRSEAGRKGGQARSERKAAAVRQNGCKGGRPEGIHTRWSHGTILDMMIATPSEILLNPNAILCVQKPAIKRELRRRDYWAAVANDTK